MTEFFESFKASFSCRESDCGIIISTPIMYSGADHGFSFFVERDGNGFTVNDRGETLDYLRENFDPNRYSAKIAAICESFEITLEDGVFSARLASYESGQTMRNFFEFIGVMNIIANIDII